MARPLAAVVLAAGAGTRMKSDLPKVLHPVAGVPMLGHVLETARGLSPERIVVVVGPGQDRVAAAARPHATAIQQPPLGTAHALRAAMPALAGLEGDVVVVYGDCPLLTTATIARLVAALHATTAAGAPRIALGVLGFRPADPGPYGRLLLDPAGDLARIVEAREASPDELKVGLVNSGVMAIDGRLLPGLLARVTDDNLKKEFYLTDLAGLARADGHRCVVVEGAEAEFLGVNDRVDLAGAEAAMQQRLRIAAMRGGVTLIDPATTWLCADTRFGRDVTVGPNTIFGRDVEIGDNVEIRGFCHIEGARIEAGAIVGPFARLRPISVVGAGAHVGNFVELKNATLHEGAKANHLAYLGDVEVGARSNIGAGTICVNYDGFGKWRTVVGADAFVGSNASLVAPVRIGDGANVTAGSVITEDVEADAVAFGRARQEDKPGRAPAMRAKLKARVGDPAMRPFKA